MIRFAIPLMLMSGLSAPAIAATIEIETNGPVVELMLSESIQSAPDVAQVGAGVITSAPTATAAMRENAANMRAVIAELRKMGIDEDDIQTSNFSVRPKYDYDRENELQVLTGYQVINSVSVRLRNLDEVGETLDTLILAGANNISGPNFSLEDDAEVKAEARAKAFARGMEMARDYARLAGYSDVRILEVSESIFTSGPRPQAMMVRDVAAASPASTPISAGEVGTSVSISVKYEMTGAP
ncbi:SIMPL domain-containing protein [Qipengyuania sp. DGS5-3]|uniref:SIMPL domain-containing protein n=1 Tax=Qipengyuania sp. DGS5-3 TaxID=3349632 RepID=UPI0036D2FE5D